MNMQDLPVEVFARVILSFLTKAEQYTLLSTCKAFDHLLHQVRTIAFDDAGSICLFATDTKYRNQVMKIVGIDCEDAATQTQLINNRTANQDRKLKLQLVESLCDDFNHLKSRLACYAEYFCLVDFYSEKPVTYTVYTHYKIQNPNPGDILNLGMYLTNARLQDLPKLNYLNLLSSHNNAAIHELFQQAPSVPCGSYLSSVKHVKQIVFNENFFDLSLLQISENSTLQTASIQASQLDNIELLNGVPEIEITSCSELANIAPLQSCTKVHLDYCNNIRDLTSLANIREVMLSHLPGITDISALGRVSKLVVTDCMNIVKFPIPSGANQDWEFKSCKIYDLTGYDNLLRLSISYSNELENITNLGNVRYLYICDCPNVKTIPTPEGRLQEWEFHGMTVPDITIFEGIHRLQLIICYFPSSALSGLSHVNTLFIKKCSNLQEISNLADITCLKLFSCDNLKLIVRLVNIHEITIDNCHSIDWSRSALGIDVNCRILNLQSLGSLSELNPLSDLIRNLHTFTISDCSRLQDITITNQDGSRDNSILENMEYVTFQSYISVSLTSHTPFPSTFKSIFNDETIKQAINLWCALPQRALRLYGHITKWDVSFVTNMDHLFYGKTYFNDDISAWDVSNVRSMSSMFKGATSFNQPLDTWNVQQVEAMDGMFQEAVSFNQPLNNWNVSKVTTMRDMFCGAKVFNQPLNSWNTSSANDMSSMFKDAIAFNQPLASWDMSNLTNITSMFYDAKSFNQPLNDWDVSNISNMRQTFQRAAQFNSPLDRWDISSVDDMTEMFADATSFNQPLNEWGSMIHANFNHLFYGAISFDIAQHASWYHEP